MVPACEGPRRLCLSRALLYTERVKSKVRRVTVRYHTRWYDRNP